MKFDIEDMRFFAEKHRGKYCTSGPYWSTIIRFPLLFDEYEKAIARAEAAEARVAELERIKSIGAVLKSYFDYCGRCGKKREIVDGYTNFGSPYDAEPPEPVNLCAKCVEEEVKMWIALDTMPAHWIRANYETRLAEILGFEWVYLPGCSWGAWQPIEGRLNKWLPKSHQ